MELVVMFLMRAVSATLDGLAIRIMWNWFVAPTFNVATLTLPIAIGISLLVSLLFMRMSESESSKPRTVEWYLKVFFWCILKPLTTLGMGWIVFAFV